MQRKNSIVRVRDQANDQARRLHSEGGAAKIVKIAVQRKESIQGSSDPASGVHLGGEKTREQHNEVVEKERKPNPDKDQTVRQTHREPGEAAH